MALSHSLEQLQHQFPILGRAHFANHASLSPWPRLTADAVRQFAERTRDEGLLAYGATIETDRCLRETAARLLNAPSSEDVSLLSNTSTGINLVANGLGWRAGDNIVALNREFPSNRVPWARLASQGVEVRFVDPRAGANPEADLLDRVDRRTRLLAISSVHWADGFRLDLAQLGAGCRNAGVLLFVDAIQHFGALRLDVQSECIDLLSAGSHKWQMGPEGMAVFYSSEAAREHLDLRNWGWHMLEQRFEFDRPGRSPTSDGRRFEPGTPNRVGEAALCASLQLLEEAGMDRVEAWVLENSGRLIDSLSGLPGIEVTSDPDPRRRSGIVSFISHREPAQPLLQRLRQAGVIAIQRGEAVRLSPHFYQHGEPLGRLIGALEETILSPDA